MEIVKLVSEQGEEKDFEVIAAFDIEGETYITLTPYEEETDGEGSLQIYAYRVTDNNDGTQQLDPVEDQNILDDLNKALIDYFQQLSDKKDACDCDSDCGPDCKC